MKQIWKTSVNELMQLYVNSLIAIIPWLEKAKIRWKTDEVYDDYDNIASTLFENIVCSTLYGEVAIEYDIAKYDFLYNDYSSMDYILVQSKNQNSHRHIFVSFQSKITPLDMVKVAKIDELDNVIEFAYIKNDNIKYTFCRNRKYIDEFEVDV